MAFGQVFSGTMGFLAAALIALVILVVLPVVGCTVIIGGCIATPAVKAAREAADRVKAQEEAAKNAPAVTTAVVDSSETDQAAEPVSRVWHDASGGFSVEAELVASDGVTVTLRRVDGNTISVPLERLSEADRRWLEENQAEPAPAP